MRLAELMLGYRKFFEEPEIRGMVTRSKSFNKSNESPGEAKSLLIFRTSRQQTWLVSTRLRLYCILDDVRQPRPRLQWSVPKTEVSRAGAVITRPRSDQTGLVDLGPRHRDWLYSKHLFAEQPIEPAIEELLADA